MYVRNETNVAILYTIMAGEVITKTILPGHTVEVVAPAGLDHVSFSADDGALLPEGLDVTLAMR